MAAPRVQTWLDEERQLVCQRVDGPVDADTFARLVRETGVVIRRLRNPNDVRVLVDARKMGRPSLEVRRLALGTFDIPELTRVAVWGAGPMARAVFRILGTFSPLRKMRLFATEREAVEWLRR